MDKAVQKQFTFKSLVQRFLPAWYTRGNKVTSFIGGKSYTQAIGQDFDALTRKNPGESFFYLAGWWLDPNMEVNGVKVTELLKEKSRQGVDVRVLGWVMPITTVNNYAVQSGNQMPMELVNRDTMTFINTLREEATLADKVCLNMLSHPAGAVHMKMLLMGNKTDSVGFTGGIDLERSRTEDHWHDSAIRVQGPATQSMFDLFRTLWNANRRHLRSDFFMDKIKLPNSTFLPPITCYSHVPEKTPAIPLRQRLSLSVIISLLSPVRPRASSRRSQASFLPM